MAYALINSDMSVSYKGGMVALKAGTVVDGELAAFVLSDASLNVTSSPGPQHAPPAGPVTTRWATTGPTTGLGTLVSNSLYVAELDLLAPSTGPLTGVTLYNGATVNGNVIVALYAADGTQLVTSASTAQAGTSQAQRIAFVTPFTPPALSRLFVALIPSSSTATFALQAAFGLAAIAAQGGFSVPVSITPPTTTGAVVPFLGTY